MANSYPGAVALVVFSLVPYLILTAAVFPLLDVISRSTGLSTGTLEVTIAVSTGAYAVGTVLAVQFAVHFPARRMLLVYESVFVAASVLAAWSPTGDVFIAAFIAQGLCTSLMLIAAVPPLVTRWPPKKMPTTGMIMNLGIFGAVAVGPTLGAAQLTSGGWRPLFWGVAGLSGLAFLFSLLTYEDDPPQDRSAPWDIVAVVLAVVGCSAAFFGAGRLLATMSATPSDLVPLITGAALIVTLIVYEFRLKNPLMPVRRASTTVPVTGIFIALISSAAAFGVMELVLDMLKVTSTPADTALLFLPEFIGAIAVAGLFGALFRTRFTPVLAIGGLLTIVGVSVLFVAVVPTGGPVVAVGAGLLGIGVAASVAPALFMAGFSMRSQFLQRVFAMIELMRGMTAFLVAPILIYLANVLSMSPTTGLRDSLWICVGIGGLGFLGGTALYLTGRRGLETPDIERWQRDNEPAWGSPRLFNRLRRHDAAPRQEDERESRRAA